MKKKRKKRKQKMEMKKKEKKTKKRKQNNNENKNENKNEKNIFSLASVCSSKLLLKLCHVDMQHFKSPKTSRLMTLHVSSNGTHFTHAGIDPITHKYKTL